MAWSTASANKQSGIGHASDAGKDGMGPLRQSVSVVGSSSCRPTLYCARMVERMIDMQSFY